MKFIKIPVEVEACQWTGKNTGEVKAWIHSQLLAADPALMAAHKNISTFVKRRGSHMTKALFDNVLLDAKDEVTAALWVNANGAYLGIVDGEWILVDRYGFYPCKSNDEGTAPAGYR